MMNYLMTNAHAHLAEAFALGLFGPQALKLALKMLQKAMAKISNPSNMDKMVEAAVAKALNNKQV